MAENAWLQAEMKKIYKANTQRELLDGQMVDNMAVQIALPSGWMVSPDSNVDAPLESGANVTGAGPKFRLLVSL